ncbi:HD domain-containing protein [Nocardia sp. NPDC020380]|uniref:HD domain-containing protein n=1 Tax=Nocardia sp. NPDC020380 TaxID=3364309 RepID=UPI00378D92BE
MTIDFTPAAVGTDPWSVNGNHHQQIDTARQLTQAELAQALPRRWNHSQGVARAAESLRHIGGRGDLLVAAAWLHDIGYAPRLAHTGFHPLDGARFLRDAAPDLDPRIVQLVANHSFALLEAEERGLRGELEGAFPILNDELLVAALVYCDMTTTPDGDPTTADARINEILARYGPDTVVSRFIRRATPAIQHSVHLVQDRIAEASQPNPH